MNKLKMNVNGKLTIGVLALQGAFEEHQSCFEALGCETVQVKVPSHLHQIDAIVFPGGESTAMGLIGSSQNDKLWDALKSFIRCGKPTWGTCAGMILLAERCVGTSAVIENGQSLIGGLDVLVCRNYFGSQISSFEIDTPCPPGFENVDGKKHSYPGVFIRAPAILTAGEGVNVLAKVLATPCKQAAAVLKELENKIELGEEVIAMGVVDCLQCNEDASRAKAATSTGARKARRNLMSSSMEEHINFSRNGEEKKEINFSDEETDCSIVERKSEKIVTLPGAAEGTNAREVICAVRSGNVLCTAFHPEITNDLRWHEYFVGMVNASCCDQHI